MRLRAAGLLRAATALAPVAALVMAWTAAHPVPGVGDAFHFWYSGWLVLHGRSPYDVGAWQQAGALFPEAGADVAAKCAEPGLPSCAFLYPPPTAWLFAPFGILTPPIGTFLLEAFVTVTAIAGLYFALRVFGPAGAGERSILLTLFILAEPFAATIRLGHFGGLLLLGTSLLARGIARDRPGWIAGGALLLVTKPHLFVGLALVVLAWLVSQRMWRAIAISTTALVATATIAVATALESILSMLARVGARSGEAWLTVWRVAAGLLPTIPWVLVGILSAGALAALVVTVRRAERAEAARLLVAGGTALSLVVTPYVQPYDLLLLAPALAGVVRASGTSSRGSRWIVLVALLSVALPWAAIATKNPGLYTAFALLPLLTLAALAASHHVAGARTSATGGGTDEQSATPTRSTTPAR